MEDTSVAKLHLLNNAPISPKFRTALAAALFGGVSQVRFGSREGSS
jgi:hypothetical protein